MEKYQKYLFRTHAPKKKKLIGGGNQKNSPPFTQKPNYSRSKSAPPMMEEEMEENKMEEEVNKSQKDPYEGIELMDLDSLLDEREYLANRLQAVERKIQEKTEE